MDPTKLHFLVFTVKLSQFETLENDAITIKQPSLQAKKKIQSKKYGKIDFNETDFTKIFTWDAYSARGSITQVQNLLSVILLRL